MRWVLATGSPDTARPERLDAELRWCTIDEEARVLTTEANLRETLGRVAELL